MDDGSTSMRNRGRINAASKAEDFGLIEMPYYDVCQTGP
jgi:hypothetical protein